MIRYVFICTVIVIFTLFLIPVDSYAYRYKGFDINLQAEAAETYDDNVRSSEDSEEDDFITDLILGMSVRREGETQSLALNGYVKHQIFADNSDFNETSQGARLKYTKELSKLDRILLNDVFSHTYDFTGDYDPDEDDDEIARTGGRYSLYKNRLNIGYERDFSKQFTVGLGYGNEINEATSTSVEDSYLHKLNARGDYAFSSALSVLGYYEFKARDFDPGKEAYIHRVTGGARQYLTQKLYLEGRAGVDAIESYNNEDYTKPYLYASLGNQLDEKTRISFSYSKEYYPTAYREDLSDSWRATATVARKLLERLEGSVSAHYGEADYVASNLEDELWRAKGSLSYEISEDIDAVCQYLYDDKDSTSRTREYTRNRVQVGLRMEF